MKPADYLLEILVFDWLSIHLPLLRLVPKSELMAVFRKDSSGASGNVSSPKCEMEVDHGVGAFGHGHGHGHGHSHSHSHSHSSINDLANLNNNNTVVDNNNDNNCNSNCNNNNSNNNNSCGSSNSSSNYINPSNNNNNNNNGSSCKSSGGASNNNACSGTISNSNGSGSGNNNNNNNNSFLFNSTSPHFMLNSETTSKFSPPHLLSPQSNASSTPSTPASGATEGAVGVGGGGSGGPKPTATRRRVRRRATSSSDPAEQLTEMSVRGLNLFRYACIDDGVYKCLECAKTDVVKTFKNKYSFQRHAFLYHEGCQRKVFPCLVCSKEFSRPDKMKNHMKTVHDCFMPKECAVPKECIFPPPPPAIPFYLSPP